MFCSCFGYKGDGDDHGVRRADTARAHAQWRHQVASHEAMDMLYRVTSLALYLPGDMVIAIAVKSVTLKYIVDYS